MAEKAVDKPVEMGRFFDERVEGYDDNMRQTLAECFEPFYSAVRGAFESHTGEVRVLDLGCGTGTELQDIFRKIPGVRITCVDVSAEMLNRLKANYAGRLAQLECVKASFLDLTIPPGRYQYVVSVMALHHYTYPQKLELYRKIKAGLVPGGKFIEGDYVVAQAEEARLLAEYRQKIKNGLISDDRLYHCDIPFSAGTEIQVLREAGFKPVEVLFESARTAVLVGY